MLGKLLNDFKEKMIAEDTSDNTIKNYVSDIKIFYKWYQEIGFLENIDKITHYHLNTYKDYLIHNQRKKASSINRNIQSLKKFFQFMADKKLIKENPSEKIKFLKQTKRTKPKALTKNDIHKLLSVTSHSSHGTKKRNYAITISSVDLPDDIANINDSAFMNNRSLYKFIFFVNSSFLRILYNSS
jgi:site-specific recombinase XerD